MGIDLTTNLVSRWTLDGSQTVGSPKIWEDSVGGNHLTQFGTVDTAAGVVDQGADFSETSRLEVLHNTTFNVSEFAFSLWVYPRGTMYVLNKDEISGSNRNFVLQTVDGGFYAVIHTTDGPRAVSQSSGVPLNQWTHIWFTADQTSAKVYVNNVLAGSTATGEFNASSTARFWIGQRAGLASNGIIDEILYFSRIPTPEERAFVFENPGVFPEEEMVTFNTPGFSGNFSNSFSTPGFGGNF